MQRTCRICGKGFTCPPSHVARGHGLYCSRACCAENRRRSAKGLDREKLLRRKRRYRERHRESEIARNRDWASRNREYLRERNREWRAAHPKAGIEGVLRFKERNPEWYVAGQRAAACNARARKAGSVGHITRAAVTALWERQPVCMHCGVGRGVDHIVAFRDGGSNTPDNLQNLCKLCNSRKESKKARAVTCQDGDSSH